MRNTDLQMAAALGLILFAAQTQAGDTLTDPTRPWKSAGYHKQQTRSTASYTLNSTLVSRARRVAVINGQHVSEGEAVGNATVVRIGKYDVLLQSPNRQINLKLMPDIVKK